MMIDKLENSLTGIAVGIRFRANFSIEDQIGRIVDDILYSDDAYFSPKVFPMAKSGVGKKILCNESTDDSLMIDNSNIILEIQYDGQFTPTDNSEILGHFNSDIIQGIMRKFSICEIIRIGYIKRYVFKMEDLAKKFVDKTIGKTLGGINDINLSFSKKLPLEEALVKREVNDYDNAIFNVIKKANLNEIFMSIDYQRYYDPFLRSSSEIEFNSFIKQADTFNQNIYLPWLKSNYIEE